MEDFYLGFMGRGSREFVRSYDGVERTEGTDWNAGTNYCYSVSVTYKEVFVKLILGNLQTSCCLCGGTKFAIIML